MSELPPPVRPEPATTLPRIVYGEGREGPYIDMLIDRLEKCDLFMDAHAEEIKRLQDEQNQAMILLKDAQAALGQMPVEHLLGAADTIMTHIVVRMSDADAAEDRADDLEEEVKRLRQGWPKMCPITHRPFFMGIYHPEFGEIPTYGGPFDSYAIPGQDEHGEFDALHFDHDEGCWDEVIYSEQLWLITDAQRNAWISTEER